ncbi:cytosolic phospholipase A2 zeta-like [Trachypithecus francoisi]|uniref:cytosolic phospholipase A2 zeta-like n=1 Tax=Trachypithecus francoisi TaxID=54180 RepID=UPI00141AE128|nr:cytosolic phospholipase A2 zeta-like [Trachypithecus francoisi]
MNKENPLTKQGSEVLLLGFGKEKNCCHLLIPVQNQGTLKCYLSHLSQQFVQPEERWQGSLLGPGLPSHALGTLAKVAGRQDAAPPGGGAASEDREEGPYVEALAGSRRITKVLNSQCPGPAKVSLLPRTETSVTLCQRETHLYYALQVKVLRATNIRGTDLLSKADCYVQLWLPTASPSPAQTRTVANCSDPEWNETFHYQIHGAVKNVLELTLSDKDILDSDQLSRLLFDLRSLKRGQPHRHTFPLNHQDSQELQVEFALEKRCLKSSEIITNGVLVAHPCLRIQGTLRGDGTAPREEYGSRQLLLTVPGAYEKPQLLPLQPPTEPGLQPTFIFHVNPVLSSRLHVELMEQLSAVQSDPSAELEAQTSKLGQGGVLLSSLPLGQEEQCSVALGEGQEVALSVKVEMSSGDLDLRLGFDLCDGEQEFLDRRKQVVAKALQQVLGLSEAPDSGQVRNGGGAGPQSC